METTQVSSSFQVLDQDQDADDHQSVPIPNHVIGSEYWEQVSKVEPNNNGVLGGFGEGSLPRIDSLTSRLFILSLRPTYSTILNPSHQNRKMIRRGLDIGAGIGRVTETVLIPILGTNSIIEMVEPASGFVEASLIKLEKRRSDCRGIKMWKMRIQDFWDNRSIVDPTWRIGEDRDGLFDLVWCQWVLGHLEDDELVKFLRRASENLVVQGEGGQEDGLIIVKENVCEGEGSVFDETDGSVTRSDSQFKQIFELSGLVIVRQDLQLGFPEELFKVYMYALKKKE